MKNLRMLGVLSCLAISCLVLFAAPAMAQKTITDQLGRTVIVPDVSKRAVVLQHQALDIMIQLGAADSVVGILEKWDKYLPGARKGIKNIESMPTPGGLKSVNMESLLTLNPDLVIVTHYASKDMIDQITNAGIPVVGISLYNAGYEHTSVLNPDLKDASKAYNEGLKEGVRLLGNLFGKEKRAEKLISVIDSNQKILKKHLGKIAEDKRVRCYMAHSNLGTYGRGKYTSVIMERAGGVNVAAKDLVGFKKVTMEDILRWNPEVVFIQWRHRKIAKDLISDPIWKEVSAVKNNRVFICPEYAKPWGHPLPESMALGELWMAKTLYPEKFKDVDLSALVQAYYKEFYGTEYK
ncbi:ABC transporter substrate-binding protein [Maridesulfovibrio ferrireducens]|uniref:ABC transporter substrate-binding protein n=1 Tax=Maridesulfovibrio ferrireducens TaxID=246191 RepID=UPI001A2DD02A|nr:ABC transporter substrate-binding protein [Maridesulfovibrio ferrireducens]MBI9111131.1 ABC transporter substrate-binding protein [Maridesulfovibrio ferrireducens]